MKKQLIAFSGLAGVLFLFPEIALADNCSFFADCFNTAKAAAAAAAAAGILAAIASAAADFTPGVGEVKAGTQLLTGRDPITQERVSRWESAIGLIPVFGRVAARGIRMSTRAAKTLRGAKMLQTTARVVRKGTDAYETIRKPYDIGKSVKDTSKKISDQLQNYYNQTGSEKPRYAGSTTRGTGATEYSKGPHVYEARAITFDMFANMLTSGFRSVPDDAPASVADQTLTSLAKAFGKNGEVLKHIAKAKDTIGDLPNDATIKDAVDKLKS